MTNVITILLVLMSLFISGISIGRGIARNSITEHCNKIGEFYAAKKVYECKLKVGDK